MDIAEALENTSIASSEEFEEIEDILTDEEMDEYAHSTTTDGQLEDLLSDLEDEVKTGNEVESEESEENELLENIIDEDAFSAQPPIVDSGEDRQVEPSEDGTAIITLDGRSSQSVDGSIVRWEWRDDEGKPIGDAPAIKVRLKPGHHSFTLTAETDRGTAASDTVSIHVLGENNEEDVLDLLDDKSEG
jgi:arsenate reductase-like glutaredoxin family protein